ncbi:MAG: DUF882 domain-containing protein [Deltaproteobacteria bacterium]|nr:DUF882 domain-containing protein [Deltaproteobacteria bacterium]
MKQRWQKKPSIPKPEWKDGYRDIVMYAVNTGKRFRFFIFKEDGTIDPEALKKIETIMADKDNGAEHKVDERLVKLLYKLILFFNATQINVISGYREPANNEESHSHHADGTAIDFMIPGVKLPAVAKTARRLGHVGVGYYPVSGFVHLDVRDSHSYFWADPSGPGKRNCTREIMKGAGYNFDKKWTPATDEPIKKIQKTKPEKIKKPLQKNIKKTKTKTNQKIKKKSTLDSPDKSDDKNPDTAQKNSKK